MKGSSAAVNSCEDDNAEEVIERKVSSETC